MEEAGPQGWGWAYRYAGAQLQDGDGTSWLQQGTAPADGGRLMDVGGAYGWGVATGMGAGLQWMGLHIKPFSPGLGGGAQPLGFLCAPSHTY